ncbi:MAG: hypothetical protein WC516_01730 [Patescibacteria group bacterium]
MLNYTNSSNNSSRQTGKGVKTMVTTRTGSVILVIYAIVIVIVAVMMGLFA